MSPIGDMNLRSVGMEYREVTLRFQEALKDVAYKNWEFYVGFDQRAYLQVRFMADDATARTGQPGMIHGRKWWLSQHMTDSEIVQTALMAVLAAEEHEARERFTYKGRAVFGPHIDLGALWLASGYTVHRDPVKEDVPLGEWTPGEWTWCQHHARPEHVEWTAHGRCIRSTTTYMTPDDAERAHA